MVMQFLVEKINNQYYYFNDNCTMHTGWLNINNGNDWRFYDLNGVEYKNKWLTYNGYKYYFDSMGYMTTGLTKIGNSYYRFGEDGKFIKKENF